ncbi:RagB/SusD family nutrient uptake outer membrane protein [Bacteroides gallinarum]|uniref:RagB/SusD family nutrient uptake outer membrane protein n=1 Tax=Bacteroides gallinarum TaxID=376806 RepID=UPI00037A5703|nr:RagB/SusD family nutrient uptake outer membrane protein [Bacteroides gallinarum]
MKKILIYFLVLLTFSNCEDFLDTENLVKKDNSNFPQTAADAEIALTGAYASLREMTPGSDRQNFFIASEVLSDNCFGGGGPDNRRKHAMDRLKKVDENTFADIWKQNYRGIYRCNMLLGSLDNVSWENEETRNKIEGETYFLRAYFYFDLCRMFGTVPLITAPTTENLPRATAAELYGQMASDLKKAIDLLPANKYNPANNSELGRATKWAAEALLARVFLFYTGYYQQTNIPIDENNSLTKDEVVTILNDCIDNSGHDLVGDFRNLWPYSNEYTKKDYKYAQDNNLSWVGEDGNNIETVFAIKFSSKGTWDNPWYSNETCLHFSPRTPESLDDIFPFGTGWGVAPVNTKLWDEWPANDIRREGSILSVEKELPNYVWGCDKQMNETGYWQKKYMAINAYNDAGESVNYSCILYPDIDSDYQLNNTQDIVIIRFADVLLMAAELSQDATPLNRVRARVGLPAISYSEQALRDERRWEFAFEALRYWDLLRWGIAGDALNKQNGVKVLDNMVETTMNMGDLAQRIQETKGLMPIPQTQIDLSAGLLEQNPGWGNESNLN